MGDKINRLSSVTNNGINLVKTESIRDTLIDLHNYSAMAIMLMDEEKKKKIFLQNLYHEMIHMVMNYHYKIIMIYLIQHGGLIVVVPKILPLIQQNYHVIDNYTSFFI